jgi:hypothetical protein
MLFRGRANRDVEWEVKYRSHLAAEIEHICAAMRKQPTPFRALLLPQ